MSYVTQTQIETAIPAPHLLDALDDNRDGVADTGLLTAIIAQASQAVDAFLCGLYDVPFTDPPAIVKEAAFVFACELIYARREMGGDDKKSPWLGRANAWRTQLQKVAGSELPLDSTTTPTIPGVAVESTPSALTGGTT